MTDPRHFSEAMTSLSRVDLANQEAARAQVAEPEAKPASSSPSIRALDHAPAAEAQERREVRRC